MSAYSQIQIDVFCAHHFGDHGKAGLLAGFVQDLEGFHAQPWKS